MRVRVRMVHVARAWRAVRAVRAYGVGVCVSSKTYSQAAYVPAGWTVCERAVSGQININVRSCMAYRCARSHTSAVSGVKLVNCPEKSRDKMKLMVALMAVPK